ALSGEYGLVGIAAVSRTQRNDEQVERAQRGMRNGIHRLRQEWTGRRKEQQRERVALALAASKPRDLGEPQLELLPGDQQGKGFGAVLLEVAGGQAGEGCRHAGLLLAYGRALCLTMLTPKSRETAPGGPTSSCS